MHITTIAALGHGIDLLRMLQAAEDQNVSTSTSTLKLIGDTAVEDLPKYLQEVSSHVLDLSSICPICMLICSGHTILVLHVPSSSSSDSITLLLLTVLSLQRHISGAQSLRVSFE